MSAASYTNEFNTTADVTSGQETANEVWLLSDGSTSCGDVRESPDLILICLKSEAVEHESYLGNTVLFWDVNQVHTS